MPNQCYTTPIQELYSCSTTWFRCKHPNLFLKNIDARYWKGITNEIPYKTNYNKYINISLYRMYPETVPLFTCNSAFSQNLNEYIVQNWVLLLKKLKKIDHRLLYLLGFIIANLPFCIWCLSLLSIILQLTLEVTTCNWMCLM